MEQTELAEILKRQQIAVLSTIGSENNVHGSTMFFTSDSSLNFFLLTKSNTRKYENISANKRAALTVIFSNEQKTVQAEGFLDEIPKGTEEYLKIITQISEKNAQQGGISWPPPLSKIPKSELVIYRLIPDWLRYGDYTSQNDEVFHQIIPSQDK